MANKNPTASSLAPSAIWQLQIFDLLSQFDFSIIHVHGSQNKYHCIIKHQKWNFLYFFFHDFVLLNT